MKQHILAFLGIFIAFVSFGQTKENNKENIKIIELGKISKDFMFVNDAPKKALKDLKANMPKNLQKSHNFIVETCKMNNNILKKDFITLPDNQTLIFVYLINAVSDNLREEKQKDNDQLIDSLKKVNISNNELVANYYNIIFTSAGNKNKPFDFSKNDFQLNDYNLANDTQKGIFFLQCMRYCGLEIWGYLNIVKPPNTQKVMEQIEKYPKFNGMNYYQFNDFDFPDFEMIIEKEKGKESYKGYYMNKYYETLLGHLISLSKNEVKDEKDKEQKIKTLLLGSILREEKYYKYTQYESVLKGIFQEKK